MNAIPSMEMPRIPNHFMMSQEIVMNSLIDGMQNSSQYIDRAQVKL